MEAEAEPPKITYTVSVFNRAAAVGYRVGKSIVGGERSAVTYRWGWMPRKGLARDDASEEAGALSCAEFSSQWEGVT